MKAEKKRVLITGGTGLIGTRLAAMLLAEGYEVALLTRAKARNGAYPTFTWDIASRRIEEGALQNLYGIVHLAGAGVADKRWTAKRKSEIIRSRTQSTALLIDELKKVAVKPSVFVGASAIGYYGADTGERLLDETSPVGDDFLAHVVEAWEASYQPIDELGIRKALIRVGIVLSKDGGALVELSAPIRWGVGAALGSGSQWMSWIHIEDICRVFMRALEDESWSGVYNGVAPNPVTNKTLTRLAAKALGRPLLLPAVPAFALRLVLGEMALIVLGGNKVSGKRLLDAGFQFRYADAAAAVQAALGR